MNATLCDYDSIALRPCGFCGKPTLNPWEVDGRVYCGSECMAGDKFALVAPKAAAFVKRDGGLFEFAGGAA